MNNIDKRQSGTEKYMQTQKIHFIEGGISTDYRGSISHVNDLDMSEIERFYIIHQEKCDIIRAWHAHQHEKKWFYCIKGAFTGAFVKIDDWEQPSPDLHAETYTLTSGTSRVLYVPEGYANGFRAIEPESELLVFSNKILSAALEDSWRYPAEMWMDWDKREARR